LAALNNIKNILTDAQCTLDDIVKVQVVIGEDADFAEFNNAYATVFNLSDLEHLPARSAALGVAHSFAGSRVEIDAIAHSCGQTKKYRHVPGKLSSQYDPPVKVAGDLVFVSGHLGENSQGQIVGNVT